MRKVLIGVAIVLLVLGGVVTYAFVNVNGLLAENRGRLAGMASEAMGREVEFDAAEVAFSPGLAVKVTGLRVAEDPIFGKPDFLTLDSAFVGVRIWPALFGDFQVSGVRLEAPVIRVVSTAKGFNFSTIGGASETTAAPGPASSDTAGGKPDGASGEEGPPLALAIAAFEITRGTVYYEDRTSKPPLLLTIEELETSGTDLALEGPLALSFAGRLHKTGAATDASAPSSRLEGSLEIDDLATASGTLRLRSPEFYPSLIDVAFEDDPKADRIDALDLVIGLPANAERDGYPIALEASSGHLSGFDFEDADLDLVYRGDELVMKRIVAGVAGGGVELAGKMKFGAPGKPSPFDLDLQLRALDAGVLATTLAGVPAGVLTGLVDGDIELEGESLEWERLKRTLAGKVSLEMGQGALENVNLLDTLVDRMVASPGLGALVATSLRDAAPDALDRDRTEIKRVGLGLDVAKGILKTDDFEMDAGDFTLAAIGQVGLDGSVAGDGRFRLSESISKKLVKKTETLSALMVEGNRLEVPVRIGGTTDSPSVRPDLTALASETKRELRDKAASEIADQIFGKRKKQDGETEDTTPSDRDAAEGLLKEGLGRLLGN